jgi:hypothetical protein
MDRHQRSRGTRGVVGRRDESVTPRIVVSIAIALATSQASAQTASESGWSFTVTGGGFVRGNKHAVANWLRQNGYGTAEPTRCVFDVLLNRTCSPQEAYPRMTGGSIASAMLSARHRIIDRWSVEFFLADEQSGSARGRCDILATPRDPRCTDRFIDVDFGGVSFASLAVLSMPYAQVAAGPALFVATWRMEPSNVPGLWLDATTRLGSWPLIARLQYRVYRSATLGPNGFSSFHTSSIFVGVGFVTGVNNSP